MARTHRSARWIAVLAAAASLGLVGANIATTTTVNAEDPGTSEVLPTFGHLGTLAVNPNVSVPDGEIAANVTVSQPEVEVPLAGVAIENVSQRDAAAASASGCYGRSNSPHASNTETDYVHAEGRIDCGGNYFPYLFIEGLLTRDRWYGEEQRDYDKYTKNGGYWVNLTERSSCRNTTWTWHLYNYHEVKRSGKTYYAYTGNTRRFTC